MSPKLPTTLISGASLLVLAPALWLPSLGGRPAPQPEPAPAAMVDPLTPEQESIVLAQRKRIMGRLRSLEQVRRVSERVRPLVDVAAEDPRHQAQFARLAQSAGVGVDSFKEYFRAKQEADLLLESGGDPEARSRSNAIGVAQFMADTGRSRGLRVDIRRSSELSARIAVLDRQIGWLENAPPGWSKPVGGTLRKAGVREAVWRREQWLNYRSNQRAQLAAIRRQVDERFDPGKSIRAQTAYLLELVARFGGMDWALQAYHGGEGGVRRTVALYLDASRRSLTLASRGAGGGLRSLDYSSLYSGLSPSGTPAAFGYVFGRSDDHRYYWWKVLMAERALALYRRDPAGFEQQWQGLRPGMGLEASWYPDPAALSYASSDSLRAAYQSGELIPLGPAAARYALRTQNVASLAPDAAALHKGLRPEAMGALLRIAHTYRSHGGREALVLPQLVQSAAYRRLWEARYPPAPLPPGVQRDPDLTPTGLVFHLRPPASAWDRKILEHSLGRLYDTLRITWRAVSVAGSRRYLVAVNPGYREELSRECAVLARGGR